MTEQDLPRPGEPGAENEPAAAPTDGPDQGAQRRAEPGAPDPGTNQARTEPAGQGNVSPGAGSYGSDYGSTGVGVEQPDRPDRGTPPPAAPAGGAGSSVGTGAAYRQAQRYGESPDPIATDDEAGARAAAPGGPVSDRPAEPTTGNDAGATYGLQTEAMTGTSQDAAPSTGVRRAVHEGDGDLSAGPTIQTGQGRRVFGGDDTVDPPASLSGDPESDGAVRPEGHGLVRPEGPRADEQVDTGSSAATRGEELRPSVEQPAHPDNDPQPTHKRPVTGAHRPSAPSGEVGSQ